MKTFIDSIDTNFLKENSLVLDIESTGVDRINNYIQVVGLLGCESEKNFIQLWAQDIEDEKNLLIKLWDLLDGKNIISYNGISFDLPFILARMDYHGIRRPEITNHFDIFRYLHENKYYMDLDSFSLQAVESYTGIKRYENFELNKDLNFYREFEEDPMAYILLHNKYDVINTEKILAFHEKIESSKTFNHSIDGKKINFYIDNVGINKNLLKIKLRTDSINSHIRYENMNYLLMWQESALYLYAKVIEGYVKKDKLAYVHIQNQEPFIEDLSPFDLPENILVIYHSQTIELNNLKSLIIVILDSFFNQ